MDCVQRRPSKNTENLSLSPSLSLSLPLGTQDHESGYRCECPQGYEGNQCETRVLTCADSPCFRNGRCHDKDNGRSYVCECPAGFTGLNCEKRVDKCTSLRCANGR